MSLRYALAYKSLLRALAYAGPLRTAVVGVLAVAAVAMAVSFGLVASTGLAVAAVFAGTLDL